MIAANGAPAESAGTPPLRDWDQTASMLATLIEEVRQTNILLISVNSKPSASTPKLTPVPRPTTAYAKIAGKARMDDRLRKHDSLVTKLLGDRASKTGES